MQAHAQYRRGQHGYGLAEQSRLGLDPAHAPAEHAEPVDHGRVRVGADERVRKNLRFSVLFVPEYHPRQPFKIDLVDDAGVGGNDLQFAECLLSPVQEGIALAIAFELQFVVAGQRIGAGVVIDLD